MTGDTMLETMQADVAAVLANCPSLADAVILTQDDGDMEKKILRNLGPLNAGDTDKRGLVLVVMLPEVSGRDENLPGPPVTLTQDIQVIEHPLVNRGTNGTGVRSSVAALRALATLHLRGLGHCLITADEPPVRPVAGMKSGYISHEVRLTARFLGLTAPARPAGVAASFAEQTDTLTLSCATSGADIYYTLDGSYPTPADGTEYTAPLALAGTPATLTIADTPGEPLTDGTDPVTFADMAYAGIVDTKPSYGDGVVSLCRWYADTSIWALTDLASGATWESADAVATPDLCTTWTAASVEGGTPLVTLTPAVPATPAGTVIRAAAYLADYAPGDVTTITVS